MVVSQTRDPQKRPQYATILIMGTPKMVPLILGNPYITPILAKGGEFNFSDCGTALASGFRAWRFSAAERTLLHSYTWGILIIMGRGWRSLLYVLDSGVMGKC